MTKWGRASREGQVWEASDLVVAELETKVLQGSGSLYFISVLACSSNGCGESVKNARSDGKRRF